MDPSNTSDSVDELLTPAKLVEARDLLAILDTEGHPYANETLFLGQMKNDSDYVDIQAMDGTVIKHTLFPPNSGRFVMGFAKTVFVKEYDDRMVSNTRNLSSVYSKMFDIAPMDGMDSETDGIWYSTTKYAIWPLNSEKEGRQLINIYRKNKHKLQNVFHKNLRDMRAFKPKIYFFGKLLNSPPPNIDARSESIFQDLVELLVEIPQILFKKEDSKK